MKWDFTRFGHRLEWARLEWFKERHGRVITHEEIADHLEQQRPNLSNLKKRKDAPAWPPERFPLLADFLDINHLFLQYGPPHEPGDRMSKFMETLTAHLYEVEKAGAVDHADAEPLKQMISAYIAGKKARPQ